MKHRLMYGAAFFAALVVISCSQNPLFYSISKETPPKDPVVEGTPSRIVRFPVSGSEQLYVANGAVWVYDGTSWTKLSQPDGHVREVAAVSGTTPALYALTVDGTDNTTTTLWKMSDGADWTPVDNPTGYPMLGGLFVANDTANDTLFVGAHNSSDDESGYAAVLYDTEDGLASTGLDDIEITEPVSGTLVGAVYLTSDSTYYLAVSGKGVYAAGSADGFGSVIPFLSTTDTKYRLNGLIALTSQVVAVGSGGYMLKGDSSTGFSEVQGACDTSYPYTGALTVWTDGTNQLLLVGRRYSTYTNGYWEIVLDSTGNLPPSVSLKVPGDSIPTTVADKDTYQQSLGQKVINALYQAPDDTTFNSTLFASTLQDGLWAYRDNAWNAEE